MAAKKEESGMVKIHLPRALKGEANYITASVNGKVYKIKKGVDVEVPPEIAEVLENSERAKDEAANYIDEVAE